MSRVEVITSVARRRRWSAADKQRIVAESVRPGRSVSAVAREFGIAPQQLFTWRRELLAAAASVAAAEFVAVTVRESAVAAPPLASEASDRIEIELPTGVVIRVGPEVSTEPLRRVLAALA